MDEFAFFRAMLESDGMDPKQLLCHKLQEPQHTLMEKARRWVFTRLPLLVPGTFPAIAQPQRRFWKVVSAAEFITVFSFNTLCERLRHHVVKPCGKVAREPWE